MSERSENTRAFVVSQHVIFVVEKERLATFGLDARVGNLGVIQICLWDFDADALALLADSGIFVVVSLIIVLIDCKLLVVVIIVLILSTHQ